MKRGVSFFTNPELSNQLFANIINLIGISTYDWYVDDVENNDSYIRAGKYSSDELADLTDLSFARIRCYKAGDYIGKIDVFHDYITSSCEILILLYDGGIWEIYMKDIELINSIYSFCRLHVVEKIEYITDENCDRNEMHF